MIDSATQWVRVAENDALVEGERLAERVNGRRVLLLRRNGQVYAIENDCPHLGCTFTTGEFVGYGLTCPCHDWTFDVRTGAFELAPEIRLTTYACKVEAGGVYLQIGGADDGND